ncbi:hypothetical protein [Nonomuraea longicatena]|uniref:Uncharacterized protein n=1 Tax=Nonomuraea longicatena TaxID=83682 RepID=A0ABP4ALP1_9ACTN
MLKISLAVMYHPSRIAHARALAAQCAPLRPELVADPDPTGVPSPLRTAKAAWAAVRPDATHHLVLQDDAVLARDFLTHLEAVVARRPTHGLALYVNRGSLRNGYLVRRAAASGARWSRLSSAEYTPTLGFVLPAQDARELASYLRTVPDEFRDDDEVVTLFCRERGLPVAATVPSLIEHGDLPSVAGNGNHGARHAAVFADQVVLPDGYWTGAREVPEAWDGIPPFVLEMYDSQCLVRFTRPGSGEPVDHLYGWRWRDWSALLGVEAGDVVDSWAESGPWPVEDAAGLEFWAAGYLLGTDVSRDPAEEEERPALRAAIASWAACGGGTTETKAALTEVCLAGFRAGQEASRAELVGRLARREAAVLALVPPDEVRVDVPERPQILFDVRPCPWCAAVPRPRPPIREVATYRGGPADVPVLTVLSCEEVPARNLLALRGGGRRRTRAAFWAEFAGKCTGPLTADDVWHGLRELDEQENLDEVLPVSSAHGGGAAHFLTPHADGPLMAGLNRRYLAARLASVAHALGGGDR